MLDLLDQHHKKKDHVNRLLCYLTQIAQLCFLFVLAASWPKWCLSASKDDWQAFSCCGRKSGMLPTCPAHPRAPVVSFIPLVTYCSHGGTVHSRALTFLCMGGWVWNLERIGIDLRAVFPFSAAFNALPHQTPWCSPEASPYYLESPCCLEYRRASTRMMCPTICDLPERRWV